MEDEIHREIALRQLSLLIVQLKPLDRQVILHSLSASTHQYRRSTTFDIEHRSVRTRAALAAFSNISLAAWPSSWASGSARWWTMFCFALA